MLRSIRILLPALLLVIGGSARANDVSWRAWNAGLKEAGSSGRPVLVDVYTGWCGWCKRMDRDVYQRTDVRDYLTRKFVTVKLDAEADEAARYEGKPFTSRTLASRFRVTGYPTTIFLTASGEHLANVPGYIPADRFLLLLHYIGDGWMDKGIAFDDYVKKMAAGDDPSGK